MVVEDKREDDDSDNDEKALTLRTAVTKRPMCYVAATAFLRSTVKGVRESLGRLCSLWHGGEPGCAHNRKRQRHERTCTTTLMDGWMAWMGAVRGWRQEICDFVRGEDRTVYTDRNIKAWQDVARCRVHAT